MLLRHTDSVVIPQYQVTIYIMPSVMTYQNLSALLYAITAWLAFICQHSINTAT